MKLFQQMLVAPAALGLIAPIAASAAELNINDVSRYSSSTPSVRLKAQRVNGVSQFSDVYPTDWSYQALKALVERNGCAVNLPNGSLTRYEAASLLNNCLANLSEINDQERRLVDEFRPELAVIKGRLDGVEAGVGMSDDEGFSTTTKMSGAATFVLGGTSRDGTQFEQEALTLSHGYEINLDTSFGGTDILVSTIEAGNFDAANSLSSGNTALEVTTSTGNALELSTLYYQRPVGEDFTVTVGPLVEQADLLGAWAGTYPSDTILDSLTYSGANAAYNNSAGAGVGITYAKNSFSATLAYVAEEATDANAATGGILTEGGSDDVTAQIAWLGDNYTVALAYTYSDGGVDDGTASNEHFDAWGLTGEWNPDHDESYLPDSITAGLGFKDPSTADDDNDIEYARTWSVGFL